MITCQRCGQANNEGTPNCVKCGNPLTGGQMPPPYTQNQVPQGQYNQQGQMQGQRPPQMPQGQYNQQGQRPPQQGQMQGQRPPQQGQRPPQQGQMQGQRPPQQGQNGQYNPQNQRPQQQVPQGQYPQGNGQYPSQQSQGQGVPPQQGQRPPLDQFGQGQGVPQQQGQRPPLDQFGQGQGVPQQQGKKQKKQKKAKNSNIQQDNQFNQGVPQKKGGAKKTIAIIFACLLFFGCVIGVVVMGLNKIGIIGGSDDSIVTEDTLYDASSDEYIDDSSSTYVGESDSTVTEEEVVNALDYASGNAGDSVESGTGTDTDVETYTDDELALDVPVDEVSGSGATYTESIVYGETGVFDGVEITVANVYAQQFDTAVAISELGSSSTFGIIELSLVNNGSTDYSSTSIDEFFISETDGLKLSSDYIYYIQNAESDNGLNFMSSYGDFTLDAGASCTYYIPFDTSVLQYTNILGLRYLDSDTNSYSYIYLKLS